MKQQPLSACCKFKVGDKVKMNGNPFDEQFVHYGNEVAVQTVTEIKDVSHLEGTSGQWIKTNLYNSDFIDSAWFKPCAIATPPPQADGWEKKVSDITLKIVQLTTELTHGRVSDDRARQLFEKYDNEICFLIRAERERILEAHLNTLQDIENILYDTKPYKSRRVDEYIDKKFKDLNAIREQLRKGEL